MLKNYAHVMRLLSALEKRQFFAIFLLIILSGLSDVIGIASIMPFVGILSQPSIIQQNEYLTNAYDLFQASNEVEFIVIVGFITLVVLVANNIIKSLTIYSILRFSQMRIHSISHKIASFYIKQNYSWFMAQSVPNLSKNVLQEAEKIVNLAITPLLLLSANLIVIIFVTSFLLVVEFVASIVIGLSFILMFSIAYFVFSKKVKQNGIRRVEANTLRSKNISEMLFAFKDIKLSGTEHFFIKNFENNSKRYAKSLVFSTLVGNLPRYFIEMIGFGGIVILSMFFVLNSETQASYFSAIAAFAFAGYKILPAFQQVYFNATQLGFASYPLQEIFSNLEEFKSNKTSRVIGSVRNELVTFNSKIRLKKISHKFASQKKSGLSGITFEIEKGKITGIVGESGAGKSTLLNIIMGLFIPTSGQITIDDKISKKIYQTIKVGYVPQSFFLLDTTIKENIAFGVEKRSIELSKVINAAEKAGIHDYIINNLTDKYDSLAGDNGNNFSGGQIQRIALARALYREPELLILDEPTGALDYIAESKIIETLKILVPKITIILVSHSLKTIENCDKIVVLKNGKISEIGTFNKLISSNHYFKKLFQKHPS